jgi:hypothetical protein
VKEFGIKTGQFLLALNTGAIAFIGTILKELGVREVSTLKFPVGFFIVGICFVVLAFGGMFFANICFAYHDRKFQNKYYVREFGHLLALTSFLLAFLSLATFVGGVATLLIRLG